MESVHVGNDEKATVPMDAVEALKLYGEYFGENNQDILGSFPWTRNKSIEKADGHQEDLQVCKELQKDLDLSKDKKSPKMFGSKRLNLPDDFDEDSDGEQFQLCYHCKLPLGHSFCKNKDKCLHVECVAPDTVIEVREFDDARLKAEREQKAQRHKDYSIGWSAKCIPRNDVAAKKLALRDVPQGMVCVVLDEETRNIRLASTLSPAAGLNLEYLSTALKVRRKEGREPVFSLDPVSNDKNAMQTKKFIPEWLAGTTAGDVLFQADYHLKELSMGEYEQPVVGMRSCFDYSELEKDQTEWSAREWFMVRKAEVQISEQSVLLPFVKMGVEAREQVYKGRSLEDVKCTRPDHPMVLYAEAFTKNFDLIAERKSVVHSLRELAKASVIAKYLLDTKAIVDESWFALASEQSGGLECLEVPQLWNERVFGKVEFVQAHGGMSASQDSRMHGVYGGVQFGLDKFNLARQRGALATVSRAPSAGLSAMQKPGLARFAPGQLMKGVSPLTSMAAPGAAVSAMPGGMVGMPRHRFAGPLAMGRPLGASLGAAPGRLQGVDLRLDSFDLSEAKRISLESQEGSWSGQLKSLDDCIAVADTFWSSLDADREIFKEDDKSLLRAIFHPTLSDRRSEGDLFAPPDASHTYVARLRSLVKEEEAVRQRRKEGFFSQAFVMDEPTNLFPLSWKSAFESNVCVEQRPNPTLIARPDYKDKAADLLQNALRGSSPVFDKSTEEGMRFRIYSLGNLEVRTVQDVDGDEIVGAVFSTRPQQKPEGPIMEVDEHEKVVKAMLYVERAGGSVKAPCPGSQRRYYVVVETAGGRKIRMERLTTGDATWEPEPVDLEVRNALAKVLLTHGCRTALLVGDLKSHQARLIKDDGGVTSPKACKRHAQKLFARATGVQPPRPYQGAAFCTTTTTMMNSLMNPTSRKQQTPMQYEAMDNLVAKCRQMADGKANMMQQSYSKR